MSQGEGPTRGAGSVNIRRLASDDAPNIRICRAADTRCCASRAFVLQVRCRFGDGCEVAGRGLVGLVR